MERDGPLFQVIHRSQAVTAWVQGAWAPDAEKATAPAMNNAGIRIR
jgi:hypothetical protein